MTNCEDEIFVNHVLLIAQQYLYSCRCKNTSPLIKVFKARSRKIEIGHFTVVCLDTKPLSGTKVEVDLVLTQTLLLSICKFFSCYAD